MVAYALGILTEDLFHDTRTLTAALVLVGTAVSVSLYALLGRRGRPAEHGLRQPAARGGGVRRAQRGLSLAAAPAMRWALALRRTPRKSKRESSLGMMP